MVVDVKKSIPKPDGASDGLDAVAGAENNVISNMINSREYREAATDAAVAGVRRGDAFGKYWHWARSVALSVMVAVGLVMVVVIAGSWLWHLVVPESWYYMHVKNIMRVESVVVGSVLGGLVNEFVFRRLFSGQAV